MAVPTLITDLSTTIASNSPGGSEVIGGNLDNYIRAQAGILRQESLNKSWMPYGEAVTYVNATSFTVVDATAGGSRWYMGRAIKATCTGGTIYGVIASTSLSGPTLTVNVIAMGDLDSGLSRVDLAVEPQSILPTSNQLINNMFRFWQRNTTFSVTATGTPTKLADGWTGISGSATGTATISRQAHTIGQTAVPFEPRYFMRWAQTLGSTGTAPYIQQHIEDVRSFAGQTVCVTILCKLETAGALSTITPSLVQNFGTGGVPSSAVTTAGTAFTPVSTFRFFNIVFEVPSVSGKTVGTTLNTDSLIVRFTSTLAAADFTVDVAGVWINEGSVPYITSPPPFEEGFAQVQRRFYKTFMVDQVPAQNVGDHYSASVYSCARAGANTWRYMHSLPVPLRTEDRTSQSFVFYSPHAATANFYNITGTAASGSSAIVTNTFGRNFVVMQNGQAAGDAAGDQIAVHFTVDCEYTT